MNEKKDQNELMEDIKPYERVRHEITVDLPFSSLAKNEIDGNQPRKNMLADFSLWLLLFSNIITICLAINENWNVMVLLWVYWFQSIIIGLFNFIRILQLKEFTTEGVKINGRGVSPTNGTKMFVAFFFLLNYGVFHFVFMIFLLARTFTQTDKSLLSLLDFKYIFISALIFFINHLFSYFYNKPNDTKKLNVGLIMFYPYARIIPMHIIIVFGMMFNGSLILFLALKTIADAIMHVIEHNVLRKGKEQEAQTI